MFANNGNFYKQTLKFIEEINMAKPKKVEVKQKSVKAKKVTTKKVKDSFLVIGKRYTFYFDQVGSFPGTLVSASKNELYVKEDDDMTNAATHTIIKTHHLVVAEERN
jgi:hypothetical protein